MLSATVNSRNWRKIQSRNVKYPGCYKKNCGKHFLGTAIIFWDDKLYPLKPKKGTFCPASLTETRNEISSVGHLEIMLFPQLYRTNFPDWEVI